MATLQERFKNAAAWAKAKTPGWSLFHSVLDALADRLVSWIGLLVLGTVTWTFSIAKKLEFDWWLGVLFIMGLVAMTVATVNLLREPRRKPASESLADVLIAEGESVEGHLAVAAWLKAVRIYLAMCEEQHDWCLRVSELENTLRRSGHAESVREALDILKTFEATRLSVHRTSVT